MLYTGAKGYLPGKDVLTVETKRTKIINVCSHLQISKRGRKLHPKITLAGKYLKQYGFEIGTEAEVTVQKGMIIIKALG